MKNRIALRLLAYFAVALATFALVSGLLFSTLFTRQTVEAKKADMLRRATALAETLSGVLDENGADRMAGGQGTGAGNGYGAYVRMLSLVETDVWVLDEQLEFLTAGHMQGRALTYSDLPADAETLVQAVFQGQTPFSEGFSELVGAPTLTVGAPIYRGDTIAGALLLHDAVSGIEDAAAAGVRVLLYSGAAALGVAVLLAVLLSYAFANPLNRMKATALRLADGEYATKTGVARRDEIGKLAQAIDELSVRLLLSRQADERQEQLRQDFLANVSHELRTPVTVLRGSLEALCDGVVREPERVDEYHRRMLWETVNLQRLVNDLMDLARLQNTDFPIERGPLNLADVLADALYGAGQLARAKEIALRREFSPEPIPFEGDYGRLRQMFLIVLDNAVKFSPKKSAVTVTLTPEGATVQDEGPGIPPEELPLIFDRFHKAHTEGNGQGSGLGLAIARQIAVRHGVDITVTSEPGHGATFHFSWPAAGGGGQA